MTFTKNEAVERVTDNTGMSKKDSLRVVETLLELIKETLGQGEDVLISGFGKFCIKTKDPRKGRNPATGEDIILSQRRVVRFKCSGILRDRINGE